MKSILRNPLVIFVFMAFSCSKSGDPTPASTINLQLSYVDQDGSQVFFKYDATGKITSVTDGGSGANRQFFSVEHRLRFGTMRYSRHAS